MEFGMIFRKFCRFSEFSDTLCIGHRWSDLIKPYTEQCTHWLYSPQKVMAERHLIARPCSLEGDKVRTVP